MDMFEQFFDELITHYHDVTLEPNVTGTEVLFLSLTAAILCVADEISDLNGNDFIGG